MANGQIKVNLMFSANTESARASLKQLQTDLQQLTSASSMKDLPLTDKIMEGQRAAQQLKSILNESVNMDTGKFDLSKFSTSLKKGQTDLKTLSIQMQNLGPQGTKAFMSLAQSIVSAEIPARRLSATLQKFGATLANTLRWQISSSVLHGLYGALSSAYTYAQDLNSSLNDIRIVTGYGVEKMSDFADEANRAAKALNTTTNEYAKASLIYFQQGLSGQEVEERTATTIRLANVTGQSAEEVSSYMTAVWNNFDNGSKALEYYADAIAALGAATASSSEEIATGLQKFSAVANTVGLSYEYATAALATVTSQTRESAETVGTAFKTIFARLESLSLGETLDDDTTMTKYSQALDKVGINIKTANGDLKDMDTILDELGQKWSAIDRDQQIALAQTVAGMRQYNNFIALLDNYDSFTANIEIATGSEGELDKQAEIYAESWEAAKDHVKAAAESIYETIFDDKTFIAITDGFANFIEVLDRLLDSMGGLKGLLPLIGSLLLKVFGDQAAKGLENMVYNMKSLFSITQKESIAIKQQAANLVSTLTPPNGGEYSLAYGAEIEAMKTKVGLQLKFAANQKNMTEEQRKQVELEMQALDFAQQAVLLSTKEYEAAKNNRITAQRSLMEESALNGGDFAQATIENKTTQQNAENIMTEFETAVVDFQNGTGDAVTSDFESKVFSLIETAEKNLGKNSPMVQYLENVLEQVWEVTDNPNATKEDANLAVRKARGSKASRKKVVNTSVDEKFAKTSKTSIENVQAYRQAKEEETKSKIKNETATKTMGKTEEKVGATIQYNTKVSKDYYKAFISGAQMISSATFALSSLTSAVETFQNPDMSAWDKIVSISMSVSMVLPTLIMGFGGLIKALGSANWIQKKFNDNLVASIALGNKSALSKATEVVATVAATDAAKEQNEEAVKTLIAEKLEIDANAKGVKGKLLSALTSMALAKAKGVETGAVMANTAAWYANPVMWIAVIIVAVIAAFAALAIVLSKNNKMMIANAQSKIDQAKANLELINSTQELSSTISDLTDKYQELQDTGDSTYDTFQELNNQIPKLIEDYEKLMGTMDIDIDLAGLKSAFEYFKQTGDISKFNELLKETDNIIAQGKKTAAEEGLSGMTTIMAGGLKAGQGWEFSSGKYKIMFEDDSYGQGIDLEEVNESRQKMLNYLRNNELLNPFLQKDEDDGYLAADSNREHGYGTVFEVDLTSYKDMNQYYKGLKQVYAQLQKEGLIKDDEYREIEEEIKDYEDYLKENLENNEEFAKQYYESILQEFQSGGDQALFNNYFKDGVSSLDDYENQREQLINQIMEDNPYLSYEQEAEDILASSDLFKGYETGLERFKEGGQIFSDIRQAKKGQSIKEIDQTLQEAKDYYAKLPEEDKALFLNLDFTDVDEKSFDEMMDEAREKREKYRIQTEAEQADIDLNYLDTYSDLLAEENDLLEENAALTDRVALTNIKLSNGLEELTKAYTDNYEALVLGNKGSAEYAQGVTAITTALETLLGLKLSGTFVSDNMNEITKLLNGDVSGLDEFLKNATNDYLASNFEFSDILTQDGINYILKQGRQVGELGGIANLNSERALKALQNALDKGEITEEDLQTLAQGQGLSLEFSGYYKNSEGQEVPIVYSGLEDDIVPISGTKGNLQVTKTADLGETLAADAKRKSEQLLSEIDIYQDEEAIIKRINKELEKQNKIKENSYGQDRIKAIEKELALTEELRKANISSRQEARQDRRSAEGDLRDIVGHTIKFEKDEYGNILNWEELDKAAAASSATYEAYEKAKEQYQTAQENVDKYTEAIEENEDAQKSLWLESATYIAEFNNEIRELELDWLDYQLSHLEDVAFSTAETLALVGSQLNAYQSTATDAKNELNNIAEEFKVAPRQKDESIGDFMARIIAEAPEARAEVMAVGETLKTTLENYEAADQALADSLLKHFEDIADYYDNISEKFDNMSNTVKHYRNVVDLVGKETLGITDETLTKMNETEQTLANAGVKNSKAKYDKIAEDRAKAEAGLADAIAKGDEAAQARWKNTLKEIDSMEQEALQEMNDSWAAALEVAAQILEDNTQRIMDSFAKSMAGIYGSFDRMSEVFSQQSELNTQYVADYKKIYELSKLTRNIQNQIDNTDSVAAKQTLKDLQQEITELQASGTKLSQYDLDYLQKKYDLRVAEIALEEAQNAKSQVRLQRMADGSWGYVYTQNAEAVENAQQNYEDKLYALQELSSSYLDETSEQIISVQAEFQEAINTIMSSGLSDAEKQKQIEETVKFYQDRLSFLTGEFDKVISNNQGMANMVQSFSETLLGALYPTEMYDFDSATDIFDLFTEKLGDWESGSGVLGELKTTLADYNTSVSDIFTYAGSSIEGFGNELVKTVIGDDTDENPGILNEIVDYLETTDVENPELPAIDSFIDLLSQKKDEIHGLIEGIKTDYGSVLDMMSDSRILTDSGLTRGEAISYVEESGYEPKNGWQYISDEKLLEIFQAVVMRMDPPQYDTGGYTGEWGPSGKLAMVHEKEIILNAEDSLNLLKTMEIMDGIIKAIDIESAAAASAKALTVSTVSSSSDTLQQEVIIHAEFPHATNRSEIEEAFDTLINRAAQYTNRNR